jgi:hypothetical protein
MTKLRPFVAGLDENLYYSRIKLSSAVFQRTRFRTPWKRARFSGKPLFFGHLKVYH